MDLQANVPQDIWDLVPQFLSNRQAEVGLLSEAVAAGDIEMLTHLAERMWALGNPYGFRQITTFGRELREAIAARQMEAVRWTIAQYSAYLADVKVVQVEVPVLRSIWRERSAERRVDEDGALPPPGVPERRQAQRRQVALRRRASEDLASET